MNKISVQKLTRVVRVLIIVLFVINILALLLLPGLISLSYTKETGQWLGKGTAPDIAFYVEAGDLASYWLFSWSWVFREYYTASLTVFLLACGICSAVLLWQAKRVIDTVIAENTFSFANAANMMRACFCCFGISAAALVRLIWSVAHYQSFTPLVSYNTLFIAVFAVAGLICIVMSALFRQAAELKAENDLTI